MDPVMKVSHACSNAPEEPLLTGDASVNEEDQQPAFSSALCNQLKSVFGTGLLAMPWAVMQVGAPLALLLMAVVGFAAVYTMQLLAWSADLRGLHGKQKAATLTYAELVREAFGVMGGRLNAANLVLHQLAVCAAYLVFIGDNVQGALRLHSSTPVILALTPPFVLLCWLRDMRRLLATSAAGTAMLGIALALVLADASRQPHAIVLANASTQPHGTRAHGLFALRAVQPSQMAAFLGIAIFTFAGHSETLSVVQSLGSQRARYVEISLTIALVGVPLIAAFSLAAYAGYGDATQKNILLNAHSRLASLVKLLLSAVAFFSLPLKMFPANQLIESLFIPSDTESIASRRAVRTCLSLLSVALALLLPDFEFLVALIGAFCMGIIAFTVPPFMYCSLGRTVLSPLSLAAHAALGLVGVAITLGATYMVVDCWLTPGCER